MLHRFYIGTQPRIAVADVEMLKQITVTQYDSFTDRGFLVSNVLMYDIFSAAHINIIYNVHYHVYRP